MSPIKNHATLHILNILLSAVIEYPNTTAPKNQMMKKEEDVDSAGIGAKEAVLKEIAADSPTSNCANFKINASIMSHVGFSTTVNKRIF